MIETLSIDPPPSAQEAAAIRAALAVLLAQPSALANSNGEPSGLRYRDVICDDVPTHLNWKDAARLEALNA